MYVLMISFEIKQIKIQLKSTRLYCDNKSWKSHNFVLILLHRSVDVEVNHVMLWWFYYIIMFAWSMSFIQNCL